MSDDKMNVIIVGGGISGLTAGYMLANKGLDVLLIERGNYCGSKNVTGGRLYSYSFEKIIPEFIEEAPWERKILRERISLMTDKSLVGLDFYSGSLDCEHGASYSVLRAHFDQWLQEKAEAAGVQIIAGIRVDDLLIEEGQICGVKAGDDTLRSDIVILADGVNSLLSQKAGLSVGIKPAQVSVGAKEIIELDENIINNRFQCHSGEGTAWIFAGLPSGGQIGGGFLYTNKTSLSVGIVCNIADISQGGKSVPELLAAFKNHPAIEPLLKDGKTVEYSAHLVPEAGLSMMPSLYSGGVLVIGDAAGFCLNLGYAVRGMDLAVISAECAAKAAVKACTQGDFSKKSLSDYASLLNSSILMNDMKHYQRLPHFMEKTKRIYKDYPKLTADILDDMFRFDGSPAKSMLKIALPHLKKIGLRNIFNDAVKGGRAL